MRVAVWQCVALPLDVAGNLRRLEEACGRAREAGADVLVTPEMLTTGYAIGPAEARRLAEPPEGPTAAAVATIARDHGLAICYGHPELADDGAVYNAATLVGRDGEVVGRHRKMHLFGDLDRDQFAAAPSRSGAVDLGGTPVGLLICYDLEFPEAARALAVDGARVLLVPTANMVGYEAVPTVLARARAYENGCFVVYANYVGAEADLVYGGLSVVCAPDGEVIGLGSPDEEELLVVDLAGAPGGTFLEDRRTDLF